MSSEELKKGFGVSPTDDSKPLQLASHFFGAIETMARTLWRNREYQSEIEAEEALKSFISSLLAKQQEEFVKMVDNIPTEVPECENNDYDRGRRDFKADIKSKLK